MKTLKELEEDYYKAANALSAYREANGFVPGARVRAQYRDDPPKMGVIPPFGEEWRDSMDHSVPVRLDNGRLQPWPMSGLTIIPAEEKQPNP